MSKYHIVIARVDTLFDRTPIESAEIICDTDVTLCRDIADWVREEIDATAQITTYSRPASDDDAFAGFTGLKIVSVPCPYCGTHIFGMQSDIDSGLRKHVDYCESRPDNG